MSAYVHVVYCDDVRQEVGNKFSIMGVYGSDLLLPSFPAQLAKLATIITVTVPADRKPSELIVRILLDEKIVFETPNIVSMTPPSFGNEDVESEPTAELSKRLMYGVHAALSPINFDKPASLGVLALLDGETLRGNSLTIKLRPE